MNPIYIQLRDVPVITGELQEAPSIDGTIRSLDGIATIIGVRDVKQNGVSVVEDEVAYVIVPVKTSELQNDSGFLTSADLTLYATKSWVEAKHYLTSNDLVSYATKAEMSVAIATHHDNTKENTIADLPAIRSGASKGNTAVQPADISDMATKTWVESKEYLDSSDLEPYSTTVQMNAAIASHHDSTKQDVISDLGTIRLGAEKGATAVQPAALGEYRKASAQDVIDLGFNGRISSIEGKIPEQATSSNKLADKDFVNSSIATNTATFRGTSASGLNEQQFLEWANSLTKTNNDYVFWDTIDTYGNKIFKRYKYNGTQWMYEYSLNNSSFTQVQWSAINSGITSALVGDIESNSSARHTHSNKDLLDTYNQTNSNIALAVGQTHQHENKALLDTYNQTNANLSDAVSKKHEHSNKALLDSYTQTDANIADAVVKKHTHSNKSVLDGITSVIVSGWNSAVSWISTNGSNILNHISNNIIHVTSSEKSTWNGKSTVSVSPSGTATDTVGYITVNGVEKKLAGSSGGGTWGSITGNLSDQTDLKNSLDGKQSTITLLNKLSADLIADGTTNKVVTASEKSTWSGKQDTISDLTTIRSGAIAGATAIQPNDNVSNLTNDAGYITSTSISNKEDKSNKSDSYTQSSQTTYASTKALVDGLATKQNTMSAGDGISISNDTVTNTDHVLVPAQASSSNQLADKAFVNSSVQTATANFRGSWNTWSAVPSADSGYPEDYAGSRTPTVNDYLVVVDASDYTGQQSLTGTWRFKYSGTWSVSGKNGWLPEYQVNETPMTAAQLAAINSGITASKVATYDGYANSKQDTLPSTTSHYNEFLHANATTGSLEWSVPEDQVFHYIFGTTSVDDLYDAYNASKFIVGHRTNGTVPEVFTFVDVFDFQYFVFASSFKAYNSAAQVQYAYVDNTTGAVTYRTQTIPLTLSQLTDDSTHRLVTDTEKSLWTSKQDTINSTNKLSSDLVEDTSGTNKFVTASEKTAWNNKVDKNSAITGATKTKITYDSKGLVTGGSDLSASDIPNLDASKVTSGTFADARIASASTWNAKQNALPSTSSHEGEFLHANEDTGVLEWDTPEKGEYASFDTNKLHFTEEPVDPAETQKTITGLFPLSWQDGIGGDLVDYSITGASGGVGDFGGKRNQLVVNGNFQRLEIGTL